MKGAKSGLFVIGFSLIIFSFSLRGYANDTLVLHSYLGSIEIKRGNSLIPINNLKDIKDGDIIRLHDKSMLVITSGEASKITITGPRIYRVNEADLQSGEKRNGILHNFYAFMAGKIPPYSPRTTVAAVRGVKPPYIEDLKKAAELSAGGQYDEALILFGKVLSYSNVPGDVRASVEFSIAEIHFQKMEFQSALEIYQRLYLLEETRNFRYKEDSLARAIWCADLSGSGEVVKKLADTYIAEYGDEGKYISFITELRME